MEEENDPKISQRKAEKYQTLKIENEKRKRLRKKSPSIRLNNKHSDIGVQCELIGEKKEGDKKRKKKKSI